MTTTPGTTETYAAACGWHGCGWHGTTETYAAHFASRHVLSETPPVTGQLPDGAITAELVAAAQAYDHDHRNDGYNRPEWWTRVPDEQVARLLTGVLPGLTAAITAQTTTADDEEDGYEPFIAAEGWREDTSIRYVPESRVAEAAAQAAAAEREAIIARLRRLDILWGRRGWLANAADLIELHPDHGLLGDAADGAHTDGGAT